MFKFSTTYINVVSLFISIVIFSFIQLFFSNYKNFSQKSYLKAGFNVENQIQNKVSNSLNNQTNSPESQQETEEWYIEIPIINLKANIKEGTEKETLDDYVGHFEETQKENGNIGLAAHNRGYKNNYFENIKKLKEDDSIFYNYKGKIKEYKVEKISIIKDTDWNCLENTEKNVITLITCVENQPEYRRCIQGRQCD
jgi:LPXTG-site transpeptidase (sortase) family protein